jgi:hypothetical protein
MSPRNRDAYLAERERAAEILRARALYTYFRSHITRDMGQILAWIRVLRLGGKAAR